jgi:O-antigen/teichoic acid export membrane protein
MFLSTVFLIGSHTTLGLRIIDNSSGAPESFGFSLFIPYAVVLISFPVIFFYSNSIFSFLLINDSDFGTLFIVILILLLLAPSAVFQSILVANNKNVLLAIVPIIGSIFSLFIALVLLKQERQALSALFLVLTSSSLFSTLVMFIFSIKHIKPTRFWHNRRDLGSFINVGSFLISVSAPFAFSMDRILVAHLGTIDDALKIAPVNRIVASIFLIISSAGMAFWPQLRLRIDHQVLRRFTYVSMISVTPFVCGIFLLSPSIVMYVTNDQSATTVLENLSISLFVFAYATSLVPMLALSDANGQFKVFFATMLSTLATILISYFAIPIIGISGYYLPASFSIVVFITVPLYFSAYKKRGILRSGDSGLSR